MKLRPVTPHAVPRLTKSDARGPASVAHGDAMRRAIDKQTARISELQNAFFADKRHALLIVFQGRDASGKDGAVRRVFSAVNPEGIEVTSFKAPTELEQRHDYLWRIHQHIPERGMIGVFNRSHYEDVLVPRVHRTVPKRIWSARFDQINAFEQMLADNNVVIRKFFLHVSRAEQKKRLIDRLTDPTENWKFREEDLGERRRWPAYTAAYRDMLRRCSTPWAPWYVVPADHKHLRDLLIARTIADALQRLDLRYPRASPAVRALQIR